MTVEEIKDIAIDSASKYYSYLEKNGRGIQIVDVFDAEILPTKDFILKLRLSAKLFDLDSIFFKILSKDKKYDTSHIKVLEYDSDKNTLLIKIIPEFAEDFRNLKSNDIKVISDLKFLVERVKVWYEMNGLKISIPTNISPLKDSLDKMVFIGQQPSANQKESIHSIFNQPFSYVWGAPGTGKTQFVLANAVVHYIKMGKKVAIFAPTNNAIEQVLTGVLKVTDKADINRKEIIRLGTPSRKFAEKFPEVCEERGVQKNIDAIDKQIQIIERLVSYEKNKESFLNIYSNLALFDGIEVLNKKLDELKSSEVNSKELAHKVVIDIKYENEGIQKLEVEQEKLKKTISSIFHKIKKVFKSQKSNEEIELIALEERIVEKKKSRDLLSFRFDELKATHQIDESKVNEANKKLNDFILEIKDQFSKHSFLIEIVGELKVENALSVKAKLNEAINNKNESLEIDINSRKDYEELNISQLQYKLEEYKLKRAKLASASTDERIAKNSVIACTLDGYIGKFAEKELKVHHIFLDEAGYANTIKALSLFSHNIPISFLGDHMQLPPVCEINDQVIQREEEYKNMFLWSQSAINLESLFLNDRDTVLKNYINGVPFSPKIIAQTSLKSTFRFGSNLAKILGKHVYDNDFLSSNEEGETKIRFVHAKKIGEKKNRVSINEAEQIKKIVAGLKTNPDNDFVILSPYKAQLELLGKQLPQERNDLKILTVHGSQGREWDTVILSVVDTADMWFVDSTLQLSKGKNLINTAVSRAKRELIIVCDTDFWNIQQGQLITDLISEGTELAI